MPLKLSELCGAQVLELRVTRLQITLERAQAVLNLRRNRQDTHSILDHQFAGECNPIGRALSQIKSHTAILALFVPAEPPVTDLFRRQILQATQQDVVLRHLKGSAKNDDPHQARKRPKQSGGRSHAQILERLPPLAPKRRWLDSGRGAAAT